MCSWSSLRYIQLVQGNDKLTQVMSIQTDDTKNSDHEKQLLNQDVNRTMNEIAAKIQKVNIA
jgi:hypothetical protein